MQKRLATTVIDRRIKKTPRLADRHRISTVLRATILFVFIGLLVACSQPNTTRTVMAKDTGLSLIVGTYTTDASEGFYRLDVDTKTGAFGKPELLQRAKDPTFLAISDKGVIYAVLREKNGVLASYRPNSKGDVKALNFQSTQGGSPCYLAFNASQNIIASANYMGGNVAVFSLNEDGSLQDSPTILQHQGSGHNPERQEAPHAHWVKWSPFDPNWMYVVDLGLDEVRLYPFDDAKGSFGEFRTAFKAAPGAGPRHMAFHPQKKRVYILNELDNTLTAGALREDGSITEIDTVSTLPENFSAHSQAAHIYISRDGKHIYTSNRGHNSIAHFTIAEDGRAIMLATYSTLGDWPRYFTVLEGQRMMLVANQKSGDILSYFIRTDGSLHATGEKIDIGAPTYVEPYPLNY